MQILGRMSRLVMVVALLLLVRSAAFADPSYHGTFVDSGDSPARTGREDAVPGQLVVRLKAESRLARLSTNSFLTTARQRWQDLATAQRMYGGPTYLLSLTSSADIKQVRQMVAADPEVEFVEPNYLYYAAVIPNDEFYNRQYALPLIGAPAAWDRTTGSSNVLVAVVDTGIYAAHPDFEGHVIVGQDFVNGDNDAADDEGHGTHIAGIIGAVGNNGRGVAGMCWQCRLLSVKALDDQGRGSAVEVSNSIRYAVDRGAKIINLSLGNDRDSRLLHEAVRYATSRGVLLIAAAGNEGDTGNPVEYPAAYPEVLAVAATDSTDAHAAFSNYGSYIDIAAPGVAIGSTLWVPGQVETYGAASGTSEATPFVSGLAALMWSINPALTADDIRRLIIETADDLGAPGVDAYFGAGRINAARAVNAAAPGTLPTPLPPSPTPLPNQTTTPTPAPLPSDAILFPETGHTLQGEFRHFWETNGGLQVFGYPISDESVEQTAEGSFTTQYFERNRFELHSDRQPPYNVLLGRLGDTVLQEQGTQWQMLPKATPQPNCEFFAATEHTLCEPFLSYWRNHGLADPQLDPYARSLALFGQPITEPHMETNSSGDTVMTQWFERARFEDHGPQGVLLGLLGNELRATPTPTPPPVQPTPMPTVPSTPTPAPVSSCPDLPPPTDSRIRPSACLPQGTEMQIDIFGFDAGEQVAFWLTGPDGRVFGTQQTITVDPDGSRANLNYPTSNLYPGRWYWVFQGQISKHQSIAFFTIYAP